MSAPAVDTSGAAARHCLATALPERLSATLDRPHSPLKVLKLGDEPHGVLSWEGPSFRAQAWRASGGASPARRGDPRYRTYVRPALLGKGRATRGQSRPSEILNSDAASCYPAVHLGDVLAWKRGTRARWREASEPSQASTEQGAPPRTRAKSGIRKEGWATRSESEDSEGASEACVAGKGCDCPCCDLDAKQHAGNRVSPN